MIGNFVLLMVLVALIQKKLSFDELVSASETTRRVSITQSSPSWLTASDTPEASIQTAVAASEPMTEASTHAAAVVQPVVSPFPATTNLTSAADVQWLRRLPEGSWVVVHGRHESLIEALAFQSSHKLLAKARLFTSHAASDSQPGVLVVTGPFRTRGRADNHVARLDWKRKAYSLKRDELLKSLSLP